MKRLAALLLALALLLSGCGQISLRQVSHQQDMVPYSRMDYERPDLETLHTACRKTAELAQRPGVQTQALEEALEECWTLYQSFYTMQTLAMLRSDADQTDDAMAAEYDFCRAGSAQVEQWLDETLTACAASDAQVSSDLLAGYDQGGGGTYSDETVALLEQENDLLTEYWQAMDGVREIELDGGTVDYFDYTARDDLTQAQIRAAALAYYRACNAETAPIYIELVKTRRALARAMGYDSYEEYQFTGYGRGYTPAQTEAYLDELAETLGAYYRQVMATGPYESIQYPALSRRQLLWQLEQATAQLDETTREAFDFMEEYELYDADVSYDKAAGSYTVYLDAYNAPFCYIDAYGDAEDLLELAHEFGHFADAYCNYNATVDLDLSETYSQSMANLVTLQARQFLTRAEYDNLLRLQMLSNLSTFAEQGAYAAFEAEVYALPEDELTVERLNTLAQDCAERFGVTGEESAVYWSQVSHLVEYPFYVISYCVSADAAMQIMALEQNSRGAGAECFGDLLDWQSDSLTDELERVGLESPFAPGRPAALLAMFQAALGGAEKLRPAA